MDTCLMKPAEKRSLSAWDVTHGKAQLVVCITLCETLINKSCLAWRNSLEGGRQLVPTFLPLPGDESVVSILCVHWCRATTLGRIRSRQFFLCHELLLPAVNTQLRGQHSVLPRFSDDTNALATCFSSPLM